MKYLNILELKKALKLSLHISPEESERIFLQAKREENADRVSLGNFFLTNIYIFLKFESMNQTQFLRKKSNSKTKKLLKKSFDVKNIFL